MAFQQVDRKRIYWLFKESPEDLWVALPLPQSAETCPRMARLWSFAECSSLLSQDRHRSVVGHSLHCPWQLLFLVPKYSFLRDMCCQDRGKLKKWWLIVDSPWESPRHRSNGSWSCHFPSRCHHLRWLSCEVGDNESAPLSKSTEIFSAVAEMNVTVKFIWNTSHLH